MLKCYLCKKTQKETEFKLSGGFCSNGKEIRCSYCIAEYSKKPKIIDKKINNEWFRVCRTCNKLKNLLDDFYDHKLSLKGKDKRCKKCMNKSSISRRKERYKTDKKYRQRLLQQNKKRYKKNRTYVMWRDARYRAKINNLPFTIKISDIIIPKICPILNLPIELNNTKSMMSPSLDKINPILGYTKENIQVISRRANTLKSDLDMKTLIRLFTYMKKGDWT